MLDRYIFREVAATWLAVSGVLLVILVSNQLARVLTQAAANDFPRGVVLALIGLTSAGYLSVVVPIGFFLAILLALGRLYHESEMAAIQSCGVGPAGLYRPIALLGAAIFGLLVWLSFWGIPGATARAKELRAEALRDAQFDQTALRRMQVLVHLSGISVGWATTMCAWTQLSFTEAAQRAHCTLRPWGRSL